MRNRMALALAISAATTGTALAVTDPESGMEVSPPAPFVATLVPNAAASNAPPVVISSTAAAPEPVLGGRVICSVRPRANPNNASRTQEQINQLQANPQVISATKNALSAGFELGDATPFTVNGVAGLEFQGKMTIGPNPGVPSYVATMSTPKGSTTLVCTTSEAHFRNAVVQFRAIRDSIKPAR